MNCFSKFTFFEISSSLIFLNYEVIGKNFIWKVFRDFLKIFSMCFVDADFILCEKYAKLCAKSENIEVTNLVQIYS